MKFAIVTGGERNLAPGPTLSAELLVRGLPGHELEAVSADLCPTQTLPTVTCFPEFGPRSPLYRECDIVVCTSVAAERTLHAQGVDPSRVTRWYHAVDPEQFSPAWYSSTALSVESPDGPRINLVHIGSLNHESGVEQVVDAVQFARQRNPRLHLIVIGEGPLAPMLQARLGSAGTFVPTLTSDQLARTYASADLLVSTGGDARCGRTIVEAQASGLPVLAFNEGEPAELIESGRSGVLVQPTTIALAEAIRWLARRGTLRERLATGGLQVTRERNWVQAQSALSAMLRQTLGADDAAFAHAA